MALMRLKNGETLHYEVSGHGKTALLLLHGNLAAGCFFQPLLPRLPNHYCCYIPDLRGFGSSSYQQPIHSIGDLAADVADFMQQLGLAHSIVLGWGLGGAVAMQLAASYADLVRGLVLVQTVGCQGYQLFDADAAAYKTAQEMAANSHVQPFLTALEQQDEAFFVDFWRNTAQSYFKPSAKKLAAYARASLQQRNLPDIYWAQAHFSLCYQENGYTTGDSSIDNIEAATLLTCAELDNIAVQADIRHTYEALCSRKKLAHFGRAGYWLMQDCPAQLVDEMEAFWSQPATAQLKQKRVWKL